MRGTPWTAQLKKELADRFRVGTDIETLAAQFGRSTKAIRFQLWQLKLAPFPADLADQGRMRAPEPAKAYSLEELRQVHPNTHKRWEQADDERLVQRCADRR